MFAKNRQVYCHLYTWVEVYHHNSLASTGSDVGYIFFIYSVF